MKKSYKIIIKYFSPLLILWMSFIAFNCTEEDNTLAPYAGSPKMSDVSIEEGSFKPQITWVGGYVSVVGVNRGSSAALDTSLIWLIHTDGNNIRYPLGFGELPSGAQDLTAQFGGTKEDSLSEDNTYTFWIMKADVWNQIFSQANKIIKVDSTLSSSFTITGDTVFISSQSHTQLTKNHDVFINIENITTFGQLGQVSIEVQNSSTPIISWQITQAGITDTLISAIGIVEGNQYNATNLIWEVYSVHDSSGQTLYGKRNVIQPPVLAGQEFSGTQIFAEYPETGLERGKTYYIWMAAKGWDQVSRLRFALSYAYATFNVR